MIDSFIGAGGGFLNSVIGAISQNKSNKANMELAKYSYEKNLEQWHRENEYNLPANQMARMAAAGLNPNLIYGSGSASSTAASSPNMETPQHRPIQVALPEMAAFQDIQLKKAQTDNVQAQNDVIKQQYSNMLSDNLLKMQLFRNRGIDLGLREANPQFEQDKYFNTGHKLKHEVDLIGKKAFQQDELFSTQMNAFNAKMDLDRANLSRLLWENRQRSMGVNPNDPWYVRDGKKIINSNPMLKKVAGYLGIQ